MTYNIRSNRKLCDLFHAPDVVEMCVVVGSTDVVVCSAVVVVVGCAAVVVVSSAVDVIAVICATCSYILYCSV